jgi:hypothetical protein
MKIVHLRNNAIDRERWNSCITQSHNHLTYAYSWYLDVVSPGWEALISEDYEYVMPLPVKRKFKMPYLAQPIFTQQLGIFSKHKINENILEKFIRKIPYFSYEINLNEHNFHAKASPFPNFILDLKPDYEQIASKYTKNTLRNIEKAGKLNLRVQSDLSVEEFLDFYFAVQKHDLSFTYSQLEKLIKTGISANSITLFGAYSTNDELIAELCLLHSQNRLTYLLPISNAEGKSTSAMFLLIDFLIRNEAGKVDILDFEGSKIDGIARFYRGFGARNQPYYTLKRFRPSLYKVQN